MVDINAKKPPKKKVAKTEKAEQQKTAEVVPMVGKNLHKPVRGENVHRQFTISQEMDLELTVAAVKRGYNSRQRSEFLETEVWKFWQDNHEE